MRITIQTDEPAVSWNEMKAIAKAAADNMEDDRFRGEFDLVLPARLPTSEPRRITYRIEVDG